jgi:hypothetical protein
MDRVDELDRMEPIFGSPINEISSTSANRSSTPRRPAWWPMCVAATCAPRSHQPSAFRRILADPPYVPTAQISRFERDVAVAGLDAVDARVVRHDRSLVRLRRA